MKLLLDEMYPAALAEGLQAVGIDASTITAVNLAGSADTKVLAWAVDRCYAVLTENVADFTRIAAQHSTAGGHHHGLLIALASRFSRRPQGIAPLKAAVQAIAGERLDDRIVYLERSDQALSVG